jgi:cell division protein ZapA (FtsZ GTPase activity inhibitor)
MKTLTLNFNNKSYVICCNEGEESSVVNSLNIISKKSLEITKKAPLISNDLLLLIIALSIQSELTSIKLNVNFENESVESNNMAQALNIISECLEKLNALANIE